MLNGPGVEFSAQTQAPLSAIFYGRGAVGKLPSIRRCIYRVQVHGQAAEGTEGGLH
jgi:hypothetical protein